MRVARPAYRRTAKVAVGVSLLTVLTFLVSAPGSAAPTQEAAFNPGTGSAIAVGYKVNPVFGNLSFGVTAAESVAGHQNTGSSAQSKAINLGVIGVTLGGEGCDGADPTLPADQQPQAVIVNADDEGAAEGRTATEAGGLISMSARATKDPIAEATTTIAPLGDMASVYVAGGQSSVQSGLIGEGLREAKAATELGDVHLLGGAITLRGMRWEAVQQTGAATTSTGRFSLGALLLGGVPIPLPNDALGQIQVLGDTLSSLGLAFTPPSTHVEQGTVFVDPLTIGIVPSQLRDGIIGPILGGAQDFREALTTALSTIGCGGNPDLLGNNASTAVTVLDLALGTVSGAGRLTVELGGVQATTADIAGFSGLGVTPALPALPALPSLPSGGLPSLGTGGTPGFSGSTPPVLNDTPGGGGGPGIVQPVEPIADLKGERGGVLLAVATAGILLLLATAELDRRKMLRAQREIPLEA
ncbi:MAG: hypothetical protein Q8K58_09720 [Acidimicrobiales bacterium]|nr:hypothetical protein [Acidimicrobiales bacterium]